MIKEAIILAGGLGTRLRSVVHEMPKPMAPVAGKPFLEYLLRYLQKADLERIILSVGYKYEIIEQHFGHEFEGMKLAYSVENVPLGTGGAIRLAMDHATTDQLAILNGDTFFAISLAGLFDFHQNNQADLSIALKEMHDFNRYGTVEVSEAGRIMQFNEKAYRKQGLINGGIYILERSFWHGLNLPDGKFSFEKEVMEAMVAAARIFGQGYTDYFIDIGIPQDYERAQDEIPTMFK